jgi:hypothetical protein
MSMFKYFNHMLVVCFNGLLFIRFGCVDVFLWIRGWSTLRRLFSVYAGCKKKDKQDLVGLESVGYVLWH